MTVGSLLWVLLKTISRNYEKVSSVPDTLWERGLSAHETAPKDALKVQQILCILQNCWGQALYPSKRFSFCQWRMVDLL